MVEDLSDGALIEAALLASPRPLATSELARLIGADPHSRKSVMQAVDLLRERWAGRGLVLEETALGWRFQTVPGVTRALRRLRGDEKPQRYSRAFMETLAIIAYRQPVTRGDIEEIRGVMVSPNVLRQMEERGWIERVGRRETPGRPELLGTTKQFLDDLGLKSIADLPELAAQGEEPTFDLAIKEQENQAAEEPKEAPAAPEQNSEPQASAAEDKSSTPA